MTDPNVTTIRRKFGLVWRGLTPLHQRFFGLDFGRFAVGVLLDREAEEDVCPRCGSAACLTPDPIVNDAFDAVSAEPRACPECDGHGIVPSDALGSPNGDPCDGCDGTGCLCVRTLDWRSMEQGCSDGCHYCGRSSCRS